MGSDCYVYAIVGRDMPLPSAGSGGAAPLAMVPWRELAAVTGRLRDDGARPTMEAVLEHEAIVEAVRRQGPALPVRFGTVFRDAPSVASALAARYDTLAADLHRLGDKVELSLTALWATPGDAASARADDDVDAGRGAGARYLRARAAQARRDDALGEKARVVARELDRALARLAIERRVSLVPTPRVAVRAAYLLDPARVGEFREAFETTRRTRSEVRALLTGPWPPYSFVRQAEADDGAAPERRLETLVQRMTDVMR